MFNLNNKAGLAWKQEDLAMAAFGRQQSAHINSIFSIVFQQPERELEKQTTDYTVIYLSFLF